MYYMVQRMIVLMMVMVFSCLISACRDTHHSSEQQMIGQSIVDAPLKRCANDPITVNSIESARDELANGAMKVNMSPKGCVQLTRSVSNGIIQDEITYDGVVNVKWMHGPPDKLFQYDEDFDGFFEWQLSAHDDVDSTLDQMIISQYDSITQRVVFRKTYTHDDSNIFVQIEKENGDGVLELERKFSMPIEINSISDESIDSKTTRNMDCSAENIALVKLRLHEALLGLGPNDHEGGIACLNRLGEKAKAKKLLALYVGRQNDKITIVCDSKNYYDGIGFFSDKIKIHINMTSFLEKSANVQRRLLFHEMLHEFGEHEVDPSNIPRVSEVDPTEACAETCWPDTFTTKCSCATCLRTNTCDPRCETFRECDPVLAFRCPCPFKDTKFYKTCSECLSSCPSGLSCFGFSTCEPVSVASEICGDTPTSCP